MLGVLVHGGGEEEELAGRARALDRELTVNSQSAWRGVFQRMVNRNSSDSETDFSDPDVSLSPSRDRAVPCSMHAAARRTLRGCSMLARRT